MTIGRRRAGADNVLEVAFTCVGTWGADINPPLGTDMQARTPLKFADDSLWGKLSALGIIMILIFDFACASGHARRQKISDDLGWVITFLESTIITSRCERKLCG